VGWETDSGIVIALLCAAGIAPADCTRDNAIDIVAMGHADNELSCMRERMATLAALAVQAGSNEYWKVVCAAPEKPALAIAGRQDGEDDQVTAAVP
jgi:hypothetical protein